MNRKNSARVIAEKYAGAGKSFKAKFLGSEEVSDANGDAVAADCMKRIRFLAKELASGPSSGGGSSSSLSSGGSGGGRGGRKPGKVTLTLRFKGLAVFDEKAKFPTLEVPVERVVYVCHDPEETSTFCAIIKTDKSTSASEAGSGLKLHCFQSDQKTAEDFVLSAKELFKVMYKLLTVRERTGDQDSLEEDRSTAASSATSREVTPFEFKDDENISAVRPMDMTSTGSGDTSSTNDSEPRRGGLERLKKLSQTYKNAAAVSDLNQSSNDEENKSPPPPPPPSLSTPQQHHLPQQQVDSVSTAEEKKRVVMEDWKQIAAELDQIAQELNLPEVGMVQDHLAQATPLQHQALLLDSTDPFADDFFQTPFSGSFTSGVPPMGADPNAASFFASFDTSPPPSQNPFGSASNNNSNLSSSNTTAGMQFTSTPNSDLQSASSAQKDIQAALNPFEIPVPPLPSSLTSPPPNATSDNSLNPPPSSSSSSLVVLGSTSVFSDTSWQLSNPLYYCEQNAGSFHLHMESSSNSSVSAIGAMVGAENQNPFEANFDAQFTMGNSPTTSPPSKQQKQQQQQQNHTSSGTAAADLFAEFVKLESPPAVPLPRVQGAEPGGLVGQGGRQSFTAPLTTATSASHKTSNTVSGRERGGGGGGGGGASSSLAATAFDDSFTDLSFVTAKGDSLFEDTTSLAHIREGGGGGGGGGGEGQSSAGSVSGGLLQPQVGSSVGEFENNFVSCRQMTNVNRCSSPQEESDGGALGFGDSFASPKRLSSSWIEFQ